MRASILTQYIWPARGKTSSVCLCSRTETNLSVWWLSYAYGGEHCPWWKAVCWGGPLSARDVEVSRAAPITTKRSPFSQIIINQLILYLQALSPFVSLTSLLVAAMSQFCTNYFFKSCCKHIIASFSTPLIHWLSVFPLKRRLPHISNCGVRRLILSGK